MTNENNDAQGNNKNTDELNKAYANAHQALDELKKLITPGPSNTKSAGNTAFTAKVAPAQGKKLFTETRRDRALEAIANRDSAIDVEIISESRSR